MPKARLTRKAAGKYSQKCHKFYADPEIAKAAMELAQLNRREGRRHQSLSALVVDQLSKIVRSNADRLRDAGIELPDSLFTKP